MISLADLEVRAEGPAAKSALPSASASAGVVTLTRDATDMFNHFDQQPPIIFHELPVDPMSLQAFMTRVHQRKAVGHPLDEREEIKGVCCRP